MSRKVWVDLGDEASSYPPQVDAADVDALRKWFGKNVTYACSLGDHDTCHGTCATGSAVVDQRPCLCSCHAR